MAVVEFLTSGACTLKLPRASQVVYFVMFTFLRIQTSRNPHCHIRNGF